MFIRLLQQRLTALACLCNLLWSGISSQAATPSLSPEETFLDSLQRACWQFFENERNHENGLVPDRARADGSGPGSMASVAAVGFELSSLCIADSRGWVTRDEALKRIRQTLYLFDERLIQQNGFFYHFYEMHDYSRSHRNEISSIDTALFLAGAITAREYFKDSEISERVTRIYNRVEWTWMLNNTDVLSIGWSPEKGFFPYYWDNYSEHMMMYILGLGSNTHPLQPKNWQAWKRSPLSTWYGYTFLEAPPLFIHQFSQAYVDFRDKNDGQFDYFTNSRLATLAQRQMCIRMAKQFPSWGPDMWGITASDSPRGYTAWGGPSPDARLDGTLVPCAAAGSLPFAPQECLKTLMTMKQRYGDKIWKKYGLIDAFNIEKNWYASDVIGIDVGISLVQAENYRSGLIWRCFMQAPEVQRGMQQAGFRPGGAPNPNSSLMNGQQTKEQAGPSR